MLDWARMLWSQLRTVASETTVSTADTAPPSADSDIAVARDLVTQELQTAEAAFWTQWDDEADLAGSIDALRMWAGWRTTLAALETTDSATTPVDGITFQVDSLVLRDCYEALFADPATESIGYLTGLEFDNVRTLNRCLELEHAVQSAVRAAVDPQASFETLLKLETNGHYLLGHVHNHPGTGLVNTEPSATDRVYQQFLEDNGYDAIGLICTQDGYVRFFSNDLSYHVEVYGNHVTQQEDDVFRLEDPIRKAPDRRADA